MTIYSDHVKVAAMKKKKATSNEVAFVVFGVASLDACATFILILRWRRWRYRLICLWQHWR